MTENPKRSTTHLGTKDQRRYFLSVRIDPTSSGGGLPSKPADSALFSLSKRVESFVASHLDGQGKRVLNHQTLQLHSFSRAISSDPKITKVGKQAFS